MTTQQLKKLYATGEYIPYYLFSKNAWRISAWYLEKHSGDYENGYFPEEYNYQLIHKRHSYIAKAVASNPDIEVEASCEFHNNVGGFTTKTNEFFESYDEKFEYKLAKPDGSLDNCRIYVTPETKDAIEALARERGYEIYGVSYSKEHPYLCFISSKLRDTIAEYWEKDSLTYKYCKTPIHYDHKTNSLIENRKPLPKLGHTYEDFMDRKSKTNSLVEEPKEELIHMVRELEAEIEQLKEVINKQKLDLETKTLAFGELGNDLNMSLDILRERNKEIEQLKAQQPKGKVIEQFNHITAYKMRLDTSISHYKDLSKPIDGKVVQVTITESEDE